MNRADSLIVGGGIVGAMSAYYLAKSGQRVIIVDEAKFGRGCSHGNCGYICPSHALPLTAPGAVRETLTAILRRNSPLRIKPRLSPALWKWLWQFSRNCNRQHMLHAAHLKHQLLQSSMKLYEDLIAEHQIECEWQKRGLLFVFLSQRNFDEYAETDALLSREFGMGAVAYPGEALTKLEPTLKPEVAGAYHYETDAHLRADRLMQQLRLVLDTLGVTVLEESRVLKFERIGERVTCAVTQDGPLEADHVIVAAGAQVSLLKQQLGCALPIEPGKGYSITMARPRSCPALPMIFEQHRVAVTPMDSGYRIGSMMEFVGFDRTIPAQRIRQLRQTAAIYLQDPYCDPIEESWYGWRPMSADDLPLIGRCPGWQNVWIASGHGMLGLSLGPVTGKLISELVQHQTPHLEIYPLRVDRF